MARKDLDSVPNRAGMKEFGVAAHPEINHDCRSRTCSVRRIHSWGANHSIADSGLGWGNSAKPSKAKARKVIVINRLRRNRGKQSH